MLACCACHGLRTLTVVVFRLPHAKIASCDARESHLPAVEVLSKGPLRLKDGLLLLGGGTKQRQQIDIQRAKAMWAEYKMRKSAATKPRKVR
jgi:hypothetical protein